MLYYQKKQSNKFLKQRTILVNMKEERETKKSK